MQSSVVPMPVESDVKSRVTLEDVYVQGTQGTYWLVSTSQGVLSVQRAASCLVQPDVGDKVLVSVSAKAGYVIAVLEKANNQTKLDFEGDLRIASSGAIEVMSSADISMNSATRVAQRAPCIEQTSDSQRIVSGHLSAYTTKLSVQSHTLTAHAEQIESYINRCYHKAKQVMRWVETIETSNIANLIQTVKHTLSSRSKHHLITASEDVKVDAKRIHMG